MKRKLLGAVAEAREKERDLEALCVDEPADAGGRWTPKDHLAHLAWVRERNAALIEAVRTGGEVPPELDDGQRAALFEAVRNRPAAGVIAAARHAWDLTAAALESCSEADLERPHPHQRERKLVDGSPGEHLSTHMLWCYLEAGDVAAAESIQLWAHDLSARTLSDVRSRAVADYNLACFYSRAGRPAEALPLLRGSFEGAADLKEWAQKDPDLDPIRDSAEFKELLAT